MFTASLYNLKGGVGKTASCVNFGYMAARDGYRTLVWDLDPQGAASFYYKTVPKEKGMSRRVIEGDLSLKDVIMTTDYDRLHIIPADISARKLDILLDDQNASKKQIRNLLRSVGSDYDFVFMDAPPGFSLLADNIFYASDAVFMPVIPTTLSMRAYGLVKQRFEDKDMGTDKLMCFFTIVDARKNMHNEVMQNMIQEGDFFQHYIPNLSDIEKMGIHCAPVEAFAPNSYAATCYRALWNEIKEGVLG